MRYVMTITKSEWGLKKGTSTEVEKTEDGYRWQEFMHCDSCEEFKTCKSEERVFGECLVDVIMPFKYRGKYYTIRELPPITD